MSEREFEPDRITDALRRFAASMREVGIKLGAALESLATRIEDAYRQAYEEAGKPYGDNEEGFTRWVNEQVERSRLL